MPTWEEDIVTALTNLGGSGTYAQIYAELEALRPNRSRTWKKGVQRMIQDRSSDSSGFKGGADLFFSVQGLGSGVWGLRDMVRQTPQAVDLPDGNAVPGRAVQTTYRILRDTALARQIKLLHRDRCQVCGDALRISATKTYSEAHHIIPVGAPHSGPDEPSNVIVLCPNHHALCDMGAIELRRESLRAAPAHHIAQASLDYHNNRIFGQVF